MGVAIRCREGAWKYNNKRDILITHFSPMQLWPFAIGAAVWRYTAVVISPLVMSPSLGGREGAGPLNAAKNDAFSLHKAPQLSQGQGLEQLQCP